MTFEEQTLLVGVGAPKCGTSWLYGYLRDHPQVFMSPIKEMHVLNAWYRPDICAQWNDKFVAKLTVAEARAGTAATPMVEALRARVAMSNDLGAYIDYFRQQVRPEHVAFGEFTPGYALLRADGLEALRSQHARVKLIFVMRDPAERFWSALRMRQRSRTDYDARAEFDEAWDDANLLERSRYDLTLQMLDATFDRKDVWIGFYETLFTPARIGALCSFIGVAYRPPDFDRHPNRAPEVEMTPDQRATARERLAPVYDYCRARFGDRLPAAWMR